MSKKSDKKKDIGEILLGFAVLMYGMESMSGAVEPLADVPEFTNILTTVSYTHLWNCADRSRKSKRNVYHYFTYILPNLSHVFYISAVK